MAHLLVVDDEPSARSTLALLLRKRGHRVVEADGVTSAAAKLSDEVFDLVVTDLRMPEQLRWDVAYTLAVHGVPRAVLHRLLDSPLFMKHLGRFAQMARGLRAASRWKGRFARYERCARRAADG